MLQQHSENTDSTSYCQVSDLKLIKIIFLENLMADLALCNDLNVQNQNFPEYFEFK